MRPMSWTYYIGVLLITLNFDWGFERSFDYCGNCLHCILMYNSNCLLECIRANADITSYSLSCIKLSVSLISGWIYTLEFKFFPGFKIFFNPVCFPFLLTMNARKNRSLEQQKWKKKKSTTTIQSFLEFSLTFAQLQDSLRQLVNGKAGEWKSEWMDRLTFVNFRIFLSEISWKPLSAQTEKHATGSRDFPCCARIMASKHCKIMCFYLPPKTTHVAAT